MGAVERVASSALDPAVAARLKRDADGLVCAVVQQHDSREVLMVGWMDDEALHRTLTSGRVTFWSRSRQEIWHKGATSGNVQRVVSIRIDCDGDTILLCTDGLTNPVKDDAICSILLDIGPLPAAAEALVEAALDGGGTDNVTVVLLRFSSRRL